MSTLSGSGSVWGWLNGVLSLAPLGLIVASLVLLFDRVVCFRMFVFGLLVNNVLNICLKLWFRAPRPDRHHVPQWGLAFDEYGMPSGHAQNCVYCLVFVLSCLYRDLRVFLVFVSVTCVSVVQRYVTGKHGWLQLLVGCVVGGLVALVVRRVSLRFLVGQGRVKADDGAPKNINLV